MADLHYTAVYEPDDELEQKPAGWDHVAGRTQPVPGEEALPEGVERVADGYLVEIDADPEPRRSRGNDSSDVEEEIQRLRAEKEASDQRANAAAAVVTLKDHKTTLERSFQEAEEYRRQAQAQYADAANSFDHDRAVAALAQVTAAERHKEECDRAYREIEAQEAEAQQRLAQTQQQTVSDPVEAWIAANNLLPADAKYLRERKGFINEHRDNADLLLSAAKLAEKRYGLQPGTAEYHEFLDREAGVADAGNVQPSQPRQTRKSGGSTKRYSAPASRSSGRAPQSRTFLTEFDQDQARQLGMSFRDYAEIKNKANKREGQLTRDEAGGRLHFRATFQDLYRSTLGAGLKRSPRKSLQQKQEGGIAPMTDKPSNVVELHDRITVTFSPAVSRLIKAEIERQRRTRAPERVQTAQEIAEEHVRDYCETMATELIEVRR